MRDLMVILPLVVCLSACGVKLAQHGEEIVQYANSSCTADQRNLPVVHSRRRRYLIFEKGAALSISASAVRSLLPVTPRGMNLVCEGTIYYELPSSASIPQKEPWQSNTKKPPSSQVQMKKKLIPNSSGYTYNHMYKRNVHSTSNTEKISDSHFESQDIEVLFFQQLEKFAEIYGYNGRHCIMRTICEAQHFLYPKGQSLFHDIIRIILEFSLPTLRNNRKYLAASKIRNPVDCANLYGPHCRISFLDYFTGQIHGKFM